MTALDSIIANFPHPELATIPGEPTFQLIAEAHQQLNANEASVHSNIGGGAFGHLGLTLS